MSQISIFNGNLQVRQQRHIGADDRFFAADTVQTADRQRLGTDKSERLLHVRGIVGGHTAVEVGENDESFIVTRDIGIDDGDVFNENIGRQINGIPEIVHTVVVGIQHRRCKGSARMRHPCDIADGQIAVPGTAVVVAEADHVVAVAGRVFQQHFTETDGIRSLPADDGISDRVIADTAMRVGTGNDTVIKHNLLAEVGAKHAPLGAVQNIVLTDALKRNAEHMSAVDIVGTHRHRLTLGTDGIVYFVP